MLGQKGDHDAVVEGVKRRRGIYFINLFHRTLRSLLLSHSYAVLLVVFAGPNELA